MAEDTRLRDLMVEYQLGRFEAFDQLYALVAPPVRRYLLSQARDAARADDLLQETFLQVHRARHTFDPSFPLTPWVMAIARHVWLMDRRTASRRPWSGDYDWAFERQVLPLPVNGPTKPVVVTGGKQAIFDAMEADTGKYVFSFDLGVQNVVKAVDPTTGAKTIDASLVPGDGTTSSPVRTPAAPSRGCHRRTTRAPACCTSRSSRRAWT